MAEDDPFAAQKEMFRNAMLKYSSKIAVANKLPKNLPKEMAYVFCIIKNALDLAENVFTVFMFSPKFSFGAVFLTFIVVGLTKYFLEETHHKISHYGARKVFTVLRIGAEIVEGLFYMYYCEKAHAALVFFGVFISIQSLPLLWNLFVSDESDVDDKTWTEIVGVGLYSAIFFNSLSVWIAFTSADSPFQYVGFQLFLTIYTCLLSASFDLASCAIEIKQEEVDERREAEERERLAQETGNVKVAPDPTAAPTNPNDAADPNATSDPNAASDPAALPSDDSSADGAGVAMGGAVATTDEETGDAMMISPAILAIKAQLILDREEAYKKDKLKRALFYYWLAVMCNAVYFSIVSFIYIVPYYHRGTNTKYDNSICLLFLVCGGIFFGCLACIGCMLGCLFAALGPDALTQLKEAQEDHTPEEKAIMRAAQLLQASRADDSE